MSVAAKLKKKHVRVKHQKVKLFRANEPLLSVFMWGVNHSVSKIIEKGDLLFVMLIGMSRLRRKCYV